MSKKSRRRSPGPELGPPLQRWPLLLATIDALLDPELPDRLDAAAEAAGEELRAQLAELMARRQPAPPELTAEELHQRMASARRFLDDARDRATATPAALPEIAVRFLELAQAARHRLPGDQLDELRQLWHHTLAEVLDAVDPGQVEESERLLLEETRRFLDRQAPRQDLESRTTSLPFDRRSSGIRRKR